MDFLKKNYEKVLLGAVLLASAAAVVFLLIKISADKQDLEDRKTKLIHPNVKPLTNLDLTTYENILKRAAVPATINLSKPHRLFNPMPWQKTADNGLIPYDDQHTGPNALVVTKVSPLFLKITLDNIQILDSVPKYIIGVEREAAPTVKDRSKRSFYCTTNTQNEIFIVRGAEGPPESPTNIVLELKDTGERANVSKEQPFKRVDGFTADLKYQPEGKSWANRRKDSTLAFNGEDYNIATINTNEVVLSAKSNQKKWSVPYNSK